MIQFGDVTDLKFSAKERPPMTLTKDILVKVINEKLGYPVKDARGILETILEEIKLSLEDGREVKISGFGKWSLNDKAPRPGRNPHTGEDIEISGRRVVTFHPSDKMRQHIDN